MITQAQAVEFIDRQLGASASSAMLAAAISDVEAVEPDMYAAGYGASTIVRIQCMAVALLACAGDPRRTSAQGAPSGASRSFRYSDGDISKLRRSLTALDTAGTVASIIGPDPSSEAFLLVV